VAVVTGQYDLAERRGARYAALIAEHPAAFADWDRAFAAEIAARIAARTAASDAAQLKAEAHRLARQSRSRANEGSAWPASPHLRGSPRGGAANVTSYSL
jgi:hypothetical protein